MAEKKYGNVDRWAVWGPVTASLKVNSDAKRKTFKDEETGNDVPYLTCRRMVPGGNVMIYIFGDIDSILGKNIVAEVELRTRNEDGKITHYLRANTVENGTRCSHKLYVGRTDDPNVLVDKNLNSKVLMEHGKKALIGFIPV
jgi:hypothetical protein